MDRVLTQPVHEGGVDDITRFDAAGKVIGHYIHQVREGRLTADEAWHQACNWNVAEMRPPWPEERLRKDFDRIARADLEKYGPIVPPTGPAISQEAAGLRLADWYARSRFLGRAPERRWLVEGLIPAGTPGVFAAVGDAGKSMLALSLANVVASHPAPTTKRELWGMVSDAPKFFGQPIIGRGTAVFLTGEDDMNEVHAVWTR